MKVLFFVTLGFLLNSALASEALEPRLEELFNRGQRALNRAHDPELTGPERNKSLDESINAFVSILDEDPDLPRVHLELARAFFVKGDDLSAKKHFSFVLAQNPPPTVEKGINDFLKAMDARNPTISAQELLRQNRLEEALKELRKVAEKHPENLNVFFLLGKTALQMAHKSDLSQKERHNLLNEAIFAFGRILETDSSLLPVHFELGRAYFLQGNDLAAKNHFTIVQKGELSESVTNRINNFLAIIEQRNPTITAQELLQQGRPREALEELRKLVELHPENLDVFFLLGKTALDMAHYPDLEGDQRNNLLNEAILAFVYMLQKDPELPRIHFELARTYFLQGNDLAAKNHFEFILEKENLPQSVTDDVNNFLSIIEQRTPTLAAEELLQENRPVEALEELRKLAEIHPDNLDILFLIGETALNMAHKNDLTEEERNEFLNESIATFESMLEKNPDLPRVQLELARAYFLKGEDTDAKKHFKHILGKEPPQQVAKNIDHFLGIMSQRKPWQIRLTVSTLYDNNIGNGSGDNIIKIYNLPFRLDNDQEARKSGAGFLTQVSGEYQHRINERYRLRMGGEITHKRWPGHDQYNNTTISAHIGPHVSFNNSNNASVLAVVSQRYKEASQTLNSTDMGIRIETGHQLNQRLSISTHTYLYERNYKSEKELDGDGGDFGISAYYKITPTLNANLSLGYGYDEPAQVKWRQKRNSIEVGLTKDIIKNFVVGGSVGIRNVQYEGNWRPYTDGTPRKDEVQFFRLKVHNKKYTLFGFSPQLYITSEKLKSNAQLSDYKKLYGGINFVRRY